MTKKVETLITQINEKKIDLNSASEKLNNDNTAIEQRCIMNKYEIMFIVRSDVDEDVRKNTIKSLEKALTSNKAKITLSKELGQKEFAYEIKKMKSKFLLKIYLKLYLVNLASNKKYYNIIYIYIFNHFFVV